MVPRFSGPAERRRPWRSFDEELVEFLEREAYLLLQGEELLLKERVWKNFGLFEMSDDTNYVILNCDSLGKMIET